MFKKFFSVGMILVLVLTLNGCEKQKKLKSDNNNVTNNKAEITVYLPEGQQLDNKYYQDKKIAVNYLPSKKGSFTKKEVNDIVNNIDKHVKLVVITTEKSGLEDVFKKVKSKLPGVITVAGDMGEMHGLDRYKIIKDPNVDVGFELDNANRAYEAAKIAKMMDAKKFEYISIAGEKTNPQLGEDILKAENYCIENGIEFKSVELAKNDTYSSMKKAIDSFGGADIKNTAVFSSNPSLAKNLLSYALEKKYMVPSINSKQDGKLLAQILHIQKQYEEISRVKFDELVSQKLKKINMAGKIAGITEGTYSIPAELSIEIAKYMYDKGYMIEECFRDPAVIDLSPKVLGLTILPQYKDVSSGYIRNLVLTPRIY